MTELGPKQVGEYRLSARLGRGAFGEVYTCKRNNEGSDLAIKLLRGLKLESPSDREAFLKQCRLLERLHHPNILKIHGYGTDTTGLGYVVTELCLDPRGRPWSLAQILKDQPGHRLPGALLKTIFPQVMMALAVLHQRGFVHRDLKPENLLLTMGDEGKLTVKVGDVGLSGLTVDPDYANRGNVAPDRPGVPTIVGTYDYMSPEQLAGRRLDARADVYALGVILYRAATGFDRLTFLMPTEARENVPTWVNDVVRATISRSRRKRPATGLELLALLPEEIRPAEPQTKDK